MQYIKLAKENNISAKAVAKAAAVSRAAAATGGPRLLDMPLKPVICASVPDQPPLCMQEEFPTAYYGLRTQSKAGSFKFIEYPGERMEASLLLPARSLPAG